MIHRSRRHLATLPARRGMRAAWLRCRMPEELEAPPAPDAASPAPPARAEATAITDGLRALQPIRPALGRPGC